MGPCAVRPVARSRRAIWLTILFIAGTVVQASAQTESAEALRRRSLQLVYEHQHDEAIALLRKAVALAPDEPAMHRTLALAIWLKMLFLRGAVTVDHYLGSFSRPRVDLRKPPPELVTEFGVAVQRAIDLAEKRSAARPKDAQARYDLGAAVGLQASYTASIEGKLLAGFRSARRAYTEHENVLELEPARKDAGVTVGTYRYIISTLSMPMRMMAYVAGFGGGKDRGIRMLEETAAAGGESGTDALFALVLLYNRERRYDDALRALEELRKLYPRNRLVVLEAGSTALRAGRYEQADKLLTEGFGMLAKATGPRIPGEEALWRYKRGAARAELGRADAAPDLQAAIAPDAQIWVQGRARVERARLALRRGDRADAASEARQALALCEKDSDPVCVDAARKVLRSADGR
jgi:tetratricopeptide (TPR) repeat protein